MKLPVLVISLLLLSFTQLHSADSSNSVYFYLRGYLSETRGSYSVAMEYYGRALKDNPGSSEIRTSLASLYIKKGDIARAEEFLNSAIALNPKNRIALMFLAGIHDVKRRYIQGKGAL